MVPWWPILVLVAFYIVGFLIDVRILFYFEHPDDSKYNQGLIGKVVVLFGLECVWILVSGLPTDAFNAYFGGNLDMSFFWAVVFLFCAMFLVLPLPFAVRMYEVDSDPRISKTPGWQKALCTASITTAVAALIVGVSYALLSTANVPSSIIPCAQLMDIAPAPPEPVEDETCEAIRSRVSSMDIKVNFFAYLVTIESFVGYWLFTVFTGMGLVALPFDLVIGFIDRPRPISLDAFKVHKRVLGERAATLKTVGESLRQKEISLRGSKLCSGWRAKLEYKADLKKFRQSIFLLETDFNNLNICLKQRGENPFFSYVRLALGCIGGLLSVLWLVHTVLYIIIAKYVPKVPGLFNWLLILTRKSGLYFIDLILYSVLVLYLLCCVIKGCFKLGMRIQWGFAIHPMRKADTRLNSILFNTAILMLASCGAIHFSWLAFRDYAKDTSLQVYYDRYGEHLPFFGLFFRYNIFVYLMVLVSFLTLVWVSIRPRDRPAIFSDIPPSKTVGKDTDISTAGASTTPMPIDDTGRPSKT